MFELVFGWLSWTGIDDNLSILLTRVVLILFLLLVGVFSYFLARGLLRRLSKRASDDSRYSWDDVLIEHRVLHRLALLLPAGVIAWLAPLAFHNPVYLPWITALNQFLTVYAAVLLVLTLLSGVNAAVIILRKYDFARELPLSGLAQLLKITGLIVGGIVVGAALLGQNPLTLLGGLSALAAVLSFVYQDALRGLYAGISLTGNKMLARGDFIEVSSHDAVGTVEEIGLTTIKVRNTDFSITTVPTYALISGSFKNWRGLAQADGRRLKRAVLLDVQTIRPCDAALWDSLSALPHAAEFLSRTAVPAGDEPIPAGALPLLPDPPPANTTLLRSYLQVYLSHHPAINQDLTLIVRQLELTPQGLPLEIYGYAKVKEWGPYEELLGQLFDHILAILPTFGLLPYQAPKST